VPLLFSLLLPAWDDGDGVDGKFPPNHKLDARVETASLFLFSPDSLKEFSPSGGTTPPPAVFLG